MSESPALQSARKGRAALEAFQRANPSSTLDFRGVDFRDPQNECIEFSGFEFLLDVDFGEAEFGDTPDPWRFGACHSPSGRGAVRGAALFQEAVFNGHALFARASFGNGARFDGSVFRQGASFVQTKFAGHVTFSLAVFKTVSFGESILGTHASFNDILVVHECSFEETIFGEYACFDRAFFERAHFQSSLFGHTASFESGVFYALAQFNNTEFGPGANFAGVSFCSRAGFEEAIFGDYASFQGKSLQTVLDIANERAKSLPPEYAQIVKDRAQTADPSAFIRAGFSGASFTSKTHQYAAKFSMAEGVAARVVEGAKEFARRIRILFYPASPLRRDGFAGCDFSNRSLKGSADFSRVRFEQPPNFQGVDPAVALDLAAARFSFRATEWPRLRHWTTKTETVTRLRRLRKIAKDIDEPDIEQSLFILQRMAERGVAWRVWWDDVLLGWGIYHLINAHLKGRMTTDISRLKRRWPSRLVRSARVAVTGIGRPLMLTFLVFIYRYSSDFGRSTALPAAWFALVLFGFARWYSLYAAVSARFQDLIAFSFSHSFPISPMTRQSFDAIASRLFPGGIPTDVLMISTGQSILETLFLFLIALSIRNHFRVR
jgi:uncharacterized protein YjbI with pentapeptide repeats